MEVYIKLTKKTDITEKKILTIKDISETVCTSNSLLNQINDINILTIDTQKKENFLVSNLDVVKKIKSKFPDITIHNVGEKEAIIEYTPVTKKENKFWQYAKVLIVAIILFCGSATAIMSFHTDSQLPKIFDKYYQIFLNEENHNPWIIDIPYSIGLAVGIIVFFNHFAGKKLTYDPTPIEVEMSLYETDVNNTIIDNLTIQKEFDENNQDENNH